MARFGNGQSLNEGVYPATKVAGRPFGMGTSAGRSLLPSLRSNHVTGDAPSTSCYPRLAEDTLQLPSAAYVFDKQMKFFCGEIAAKRPIIKLLLSDRFSEKIRTRNDGEKP